MKKNDIKFKEKTETLIKLVPIIYPIIVFIGFYNYFAYYRFFDIEIFHYLSITELLFSFISLIIPIIIVFFLIIFYLFFMVIIERNDSKDNTKKAINLFSDEDKIYLSEAEKRLNRINSKKEFNFSLIYNKTHINLSRHWTLFIIKTKQKKYSRAFSHLFSSIYFLIGSLIKIILWVFFVTFTVLSWQIIFEPVKGELINYKPYFSSKKSILLFTTIWSVILYSITYKAKKGLSQKFVIFFQTIPIIFIVFLSITIYQKMNAENTTNHQTKDVSFFYNKKNIKSDKNKVYIGKTSNYLFLRNLESKTNYIYSINDIKELKIKTLKTSE